MRNDHEHSLHPNPRNLGRNAARGLRRLLAPFALLALTGCATQTRYVSTYCLTKAQFDQLKATQPPKIRDQLTGDADKDTRILAGSAVRLRAYSDGLLEVLGGCLEPSK